MITGESNNLIYLLEKTCHTIKTILISYQLTVKKMETEIFIQISQSSTAF